MEINQRQDWEQSPFIKQSSKHRDIAPHYQSVHNLQRAGEDIVNAGPQSGQLKPFDLRQQEQNLRKSQYGEELKQQMQEAQNKKQFEKQHQKVEDLQYLDSSYNYNPFGKGGSGAPLRNQYGEVITSRKPQFRNEYTRLHLNRRVDPSVASRAAVSRHTSHSNFQPETRQQTQLPQQQSQYQEQNQDDFFGSDNNKFDLNKPSAAGIQNPDFQPDYFVEQRQNPPKKEEPQVDYYVQQEQQPQQQQQVQVYDYSVWLTELLNLLYYERMTREEEDRRRRENQMQEEERLRREKDDLDYRYQKELKERENAYNRLQEDTLNRLEDFWQKLHNEEANKWEEVMTTRPVVQYVERDDTLKLSQNLVDHLQKAIRTELDKVKSNIDMQEVDLTSQINQLKKENFDADKERMSTITAIDQINRNIEDQRKSDQIRSKYVYQTLLWDKMLENRLFQNQSLEDNEQLTNKTKYLKPVEKDKYEISDQIDVPDRKSDIPQGGINVDKLNAQRINDRNNNRINKLSQMQKQPKQPEQELDFLDKELMKASKKFSDASTPYSRYGGLMIGEHQKNYI